MKTANKPAVPLSRLEAFRIGMLRYDQLTLGDHQELHRRANAYRDLVEALRIQVRRMDLCMLGPVNDAGREIADELAAEAEQCRTLLRELGEAS